MTKFDNQKLSLTIKQILFEQGKKINDLSEELGYSNSFLYKFLSGNKQSDFLAEKLIYHFGLNKNDYLLKKEGEE